MSNQFELKHIHGIPYYLDGTIINTFELVAGKPGIKCIAIGTYHPESDSITYYPDWAERVQPNLDSFRENIAAQDRDKIRENIIKPQKQRKATRTPRKTTTRTKSVKSK